MTLEFDDSKSAIMHFLCTFRMLFIVVQKVKMMKVNQRYKMHGNCLIWAETL